jgi:hypothetical protein
VIIREHTHVDPGVEKNADVLRMHPIVDLFASPIFATRRNAGLHVDYSCGRSDAIELHERIAPDVRIGNRPGDSAVSRFSQLHVVARITDVRFEQFMSAWMPQDLVDTTACHDVAAEEQRYRTGALLIGFTHC